MQLPDFKKYLEIQKLFEAMGIAEIPVLPLVDFKEDVREKYPEFIPDPKEIELTSEIKKGKDVHIDEVRVSANGLLEHKGRKIAAYIRDQASGYIGEYRFHLYDCSTMRHMRNAGREYRYVVTTRDDGKFVVNEKSGRRNIIVELQLCANCRRSLGYIGISFLSLKRYFKDYDSYVLPTIRSIENVKIIQDYTPDFPVLAKKYKESIGYKCQSCNVMCSNQKNLLHVHHLNGNPSDNERHNLRVLCVDCHANQYHHQHMLNNPRFKKEINEIKSLRKQQGILQLDIS